MLCEVFVSWRCFEKEKKDVYEEVVHITIMQANKSI